MNHELSRQPPPRRPDFGDAKRLKAPRGCAGLSAGKGASCRWSWTLFSLPLRVTAAYRLPTEGGNPGVLGSEAPEPTIQVVRAGHEPQACRAARPCRVCRRGPLTQNWVRTAGVGAGVWGLLGRPTPKPLGASVSSAPGESRGCCVLNTPAAALGAERVCRNTDRLCCPRHSRRWGVSRWPPCGLTLAAGLLSSPLPR